MSVLLSVLTRPRRIADRRMRGFAAGLAALFAVSSVAAFGLAGSELGARRAFVEAPVETVAVSTNAYAVHTSTDAIHVALIGDSWVSKSKLDAPMASALDAVGLGEVAVRGLGQGGATSRRILRNLLADDAGEFASDTLLEDESLRYVIVIAGVNDSAQHLGADFYAHHVTEIARVLLSRGVTPIVLEVPEYGIEAIRAKRTGVRLAKDVLLSALFDDGDVDVVEKYRDALAAKLEAAGLRDAVDLVPFAPVVADYHAATDLYQDPAHLNDAGREILAAHLAAAVRDRMDRDGVAQTAPIRLVAR